MILAFCGVGAMHRLDDVTRQRAYYEATAEFYESMHVAVDDEHFTALCWLSGIVSHHQIRSVLDIGSGTGRAISYLKARHADTQVVGIEPSEPLRKIGHRNGLDESELIEGDATRLAFPDKSFDLVCEFAVLHHIRKPETAITEMLRVARRMVFISDENHFAAGSPFRAAVKRGLNSLGLWRLSYWLRTGGTGYRESEEDGISYPYSVFDSWDLLKTHSRSLHVMNTGAGNRNLYRSAPHVALLAILKP